MTDTLTITQPACSCRHTITAHAYRPGPRPMARDLRCGRCDCATYTSQTTALGGDEIPGFVRWLLDQSVDGSEVERALEKPWAYQDWADAFRAGITLDDLDC